VTQPLFVDDRGQVRSVTPDIAEQSGWRPATKVDVENALKVKEAESLGGKAKTALEGTARGALSTALAVPRLAASAGSALAGGEFGTDLPTGGEAVSMLTGITQSGGIDPHAVELAHEEEVNQRLRAQVNPLTAGAGEALGQTAVLAGIGVPGATGVVGKGVTRALGGRVLGRTIGAGVSTALEGAPLGLIQAQDQAYLENRQLTAEQSVAAAGLGAALGFGLGAGTHALGEGLSKVFGAAKGALQKAGEGGEASLLRKAMGTGDEAVGNAIESTLNKKLVAPDVVDHVRDGFSGKNLAAARDELHNAAAREVSAAANDSLESVRRLADKVDNRGWKLAQVEAREGTFAADALEQTQAHAAAIREDVSGTIAQLGKDAPETLKGLAAQLDRQEMVIRGAGSAAKANLAMDQMRRDLLTTTKAFEQSARRVQNVDTKALMDVLTDKVGGHYERAQQFLMDSSTWGAQGEAQAAVNTARADLIRAERNSLGAFTQRLEGEEYLGAGRTRDAYVAHEGKLLSTIRNFGSAEGAVGERSVRDWLTSANDFAQATKKYGLDVGDIKAVDRVQSALQKFDGSLNTVAKKTAAIDQAQNFIATTTGSQGVFSGATIAGSVLGGIPGAAVGAGLDAIMNPGKFLAQRMRFEQMAVKTSERLGLALDKFFGPMSKAAATVSRAAETAGQVARPAAVPSVLGAFGAGAKNAAAAFEKRQQELLTASANMNESVRTAMSDTYGEMAHRDTAGYASAVMTANNALSFLMGKMPEGGPNLQSLTPITSQLVPSKVEIQTFANYYNAVNDPIGVVEDMARGRLPSPEAIEAIKVVYPSLYGKIQVETMTRLREMDVDGTEVPISSRMLLDTMLDLNGAGEPTFKPSFGAQWGPAIGTAAEEQQPRPRPGPSSLGIGKRLNTGTSTMLGGM
jgi:hypothetical protein